MIEAGKNRHAMNLAGQRAVNAKAYLVQQQGIDASRVEVRQGAGQSQVADSIRAPEGANENACAELQNTTAVDESVVKPSENAYRSRGRRRRCDIITRRAARSSNECG